MQNFRDETVEYGHDYFFSAYAKQYGKTYLEDFEAIKRTGNGRIHEISRHVAARKKIRLLDIGCAYGPFLQAAAENGWEVTGIDISREATGYVSETLGLNAYCMDVREPEELDNLGTFDAVTMWFVIEHFEELDIVLKRVQALLRPGGVFAFSTPNGSGISARRDEREFYRRSPSDHYSVLSPKTATALLRTRGFETKSVRVTGHHPERFRLPMNVSVGTEEGVFYRLIRAYSRLRRLGDTFELYAEYRA